VVAKSFESCEKVVFARFGTSSSLVKKSIRFQLFFAIFYFARNAKPTATERRRLMAIETAQLLLSHIFYLFVVFF
jgi:hypothetical protein